ncbi:MAG: YCF48-related protein [Anaerolineales bacterium]|nr:YCF48-related protein [Anaerolineales bacterium]
MSKISRYLMICLVIFMVGCSKPQGESIIPPTGTLHPAIETVTETITSGQTLSQTTITPEPASAETDQAPAEPTVNMTQELAGVPIQLLPAGTDITIRKIQMIDKQNGWVIAVGGSETEHILRTVDGGKTWQDVTPAQPIASEMTGFIPANFSAWDANTAWTIVAGSNLIWTTHNGGVNWDVVPVSFRIMYQALISSLDENHAWVFQFIEGGMQHVYTALNRTSDGGNSWELLLDPYTDSTIQGFDKTGAVFINSQYGWLTRDFRGVDPNVHLNVTRDGGFTWEGLYIPPPPTLPDVFNGGSCGLFDPHLLSTQEGSFRLLCLFFEDDTLKEKNFLYKTTDGGNNWKILNMPDGDLYYTGNRLYAVSRDIYKSDDGGQNWQLIRTVNWDGQFSFIDQNTAFAVAYDPDDDEYALVKTTDGCSSFSIIMPDLITSPSIR